MLRISGISKSFGPTRANDDVSMALAPGEIVGLLGENGAGKSTLLSIAAGYLKPDSGQVTLNGQQLAFGSPRKAIALGIGLVHQHLSVIPEFSVGEQLDLAGYRRPELPDIVKSLSRDERVERLSLGERQRLEIARTMVSEPRVLLLDEPTSILSPAEANRLFSHLRKLRDCGTTVVLVTHKLREVLNVADRILVMRHGKVCGGCQRGANGLWNPGDETDILSLMFGEGEVPTASQPATRAAAVLGNLAPVLSLTGLRTTSDEGTPSNQETSATFEGGVLYAVAGIDGQGQGELARAIAGYDAHAGLVAICGRDVSASSALKRAARGVSLLVDDRLGEGAIGEFTLAENLALKRSQRTSMKAHGVMRWSSIGRQTEDLARGWNVQPGNSDAIFSTLSGGNMQRFLAGKELRENPACLIAINPVQGLDAHTSAFLWKRFRDACDAGGMVLVFTTDLDEAMEHGDRVGVMCNGRLSEFTDRSVADRSKLAAMMVNGW